VVLPFQNLSGDPGQEYFSDGLTEVLTGDLSRISSLFVIARNSAFTYKGKTVKVQDIGHEMGVRYVLEGSVLKADGRVRITAQLIDTTTGYHLWSERYDRPLQDIFALQDEIVQKIVTTLKLQLVLQEQGQSARKHTNNLEAYDAFLRGMAYLIFDKKTEVTVQARQLFEQAIALDPQYAEAHGFLGGTYWMEWVNRWSVDPQTLERALELVQKAIALDDSLPAAHALLGLVYALKQQYDQALAACARAIALDPHEASGYALRAEVLSRVSRSEEALQMIEQAMHRKALTPDGHLIFVGEAYALAGKPEEAIAPLRQYLSRYPNFLGGHLDLAAGYSELGREAEARTEAAEVLRLNPQFSLEVHKERAPIKDPAVLERHIAALRRAGLK
jgi:adenylate cyclase